MFAGMCVCVNVYILESYSPRKQLADQLELKLADKVEVEVTIKLYSLGACDLLL